MPRVVIEDLEGEQRISDEEMKAVLGGIDIGGRYEPGQRQAPSDKPDWMKRSPGLSTSPGARGTRGRENVPDGVNGPVGVIQ